MCTEDSCWGCPFWCSGGTVITSWWCGPPDLGLVSGSGGPLACAGGPPVLTVSADQAVVERGLREGTLVCPCGGGLAPWGWGRPGLVRDLGSSLRVHPRGGRGRSCAVTHVLLLVDGLLRRADTVAVIGSALADKAVGHGHRAIAARLGRPASTVRGWLRRFGS